MNKITNEIVKDYELYLDSSSLLSSELESFKELAETLKANNKKLKVISNVKNDLNTIYKGHKNQKQAIKLLQKYDNDDLIDYIQTDDSVTCCEYFKTNLVNCNNKTCIFTDSNELIDYINTLGNKLIIHVSFLEKKIQPTNKINPDDALIKKAIANKGILLISILLDNSASMKGDKIKKLKESLMEFNNILVANKLEQIIQFEIVNFSGFDVTISKAYDEKLDINKIVAGGLSFVGEGITTCLNRLDSYYDDLLKKGIKLYKPWLITLVNGENYDDCSKACVKIQEMYKKNRLTYFPFTLSDNEFIDNLIILKHMKKHIQIKDQQYDDLFKWIYNLSLKRVSTPLEQSFTIDVNSYEGWTIK